MRITSSARNIPHPLNTEPPRSRTRNNLALGRRWVWYADHMEVDILPVLFHYILSSLSLVWVVQELSFMWFLIVMRVVDAAATA